MDTNFRGCFRFSIEFRAKVAKKIYVCVYIKESLNKDRIR
jgi:hypothetical protein